MAYIDSGNGRMIHVQASELQPVDAEFTEYRMYFNEAGKHMESMYIWDSPWAAVHALGPGFYCIAAWNDYQIRKLCEIRPTGQELAACVA